MSSDPMRHVLSLAGEIGPRPSTQAAEAQAATYLAGAMREWADKVRVEPFQSFTSFSWSWMVIYGAGAAAAALLWFWPVAALPLAAVTYWAFWAQANNRLELGRLFPQRPSQNVLGIVKPSGAFRSRVLLVAHYDSARSALVWSPQQVPFFRFTFLLSYVCSLLLVLIALLAVSGPLAARLGLPWPPPLLWASLAAVCGADQLVNLLVLVHRELFCVVTPGANDNGSGVAATLLAGEHLAQARLEHTEVWCVATGCEEVGMTGMHAFLEAHRADLSGAHVVVLDNLGKGQLKYTRGEGLLGMRPCDSYLVNLAQGVARHHRDWNVAAGWNRLFPTDMTPALQARLSAIGLRAEDDHGLLPHWHWPTDVPDNVDPANVAVAAAFVCELLQAIDASA